MSSIALNSTERLGVARSMSTIYHHALRVSADEIEAMNREQLMQLCLEQYSLLLVIISIVRNTHAELATRIVMVDYFVETVHRCVRKSIKDVTERTPVLYSGEVKDSSGKRIKSGKIGIAERVGVHANTVSSVYTKMETCGLIKKDYRIEANQKHIDVSMQPAFLLNPLVQERDNVKKERKPKDQAICPRCGSANCEVHTLTVCRDCKRMTDTIPSSESPSADVSSVSSELPHDEMMIVESTLSLSHEEETLPAPPCEENTETDEAEVWVSITEQKRGSRYTQHTRLRQLEAIGEMIASGITRAQYLAAYDKRNDAWWREHNGTLEATDLWKVEKESGEHRIVRLLARLNVQSSHRPLPPVPPASPYERTIWWKGREIPEEQAYREGYEGGFERFKKGDHPDDDLAATLKRLQAEGKLPTFTEDQEEGQAEHE